MLNIGDRVEIPSIEREGTISYINHADFVTHFLNPIQVDLDEPYHDARAYRTNLKDIRKVDDDD